MKYRLTGEEMELLAMHRAKLDAKLEIFHWGTKKEQKEVYVLEEDETIISLNKYGDMWEAETIAIPWIHHSQEVIVEHSKYSGTVVVEKTIVRSDDSGAVHMYIYWR